MAQLGGKNVRTLLTSLEVLSDDGKTVLMLDSADGLGGGGVKIKVRKPFESTYNYDLPTWTVTKKDAETLSKVMLNGEIKYMLATVEGIVETRFTAEDVNGNEVEKQVEARCSQLDIERAKAANIEEEKDLLAKTLIVQHMDDKHVSISVDGCRYCEAAIDNATRASYDYADVEPSTFIEDSPEF
jgi:hypothetical protein